MTTPNDPRGARRIAAYAKTMGKKDARSETPPEKGESAEDSSRSPQSAGLLKTGAESNYRKVAKFLVLVGVAEASRILAKLSPDQVEKVSREIATIRRIEDAEAESLLAEFRSLLSGGGRAGAAAHPSGGVETAREVLRAAFGPEKGDALLVKAVPEAAANPFAFLDDFQGDQVSLLLKDESSATAALVLSRVSAKTAAAAMAAMEPLKRLETLRRIGHLGKVDADVIERVATALRDKARQVSRSEGSAVDGRAALAEILKRADSSLGERLLDELEANDPELGKDLKERLYTLDDVIKAEDRAVQERLREMENRDIALLLKGRRPSYIEKILSNLSATRRAIVEEERTLLGAVPRKEAEKVAREFLAWFRLGREEGRILLVDDEDVVI